MPKMQPIILVFSSNLAGRHGKGHALQARLHHGAITGQAIGLQGSSYAIPTRDKNHNILSLETIKRFIDEFLSVAIANPHTTYQLTPIAAGKSGYPRTIIEPLFYNAPPNVLWPAEWN